MFSIFVKKHDLKLFILIPVPVFKRVLFIWWEIIQFKIFVWQSMQTSRIVSAFKEEIGIICFSYLEKRSLSLYHQSLTLELDGSRLALIWAWFAASGPTLLAITAWVMNSELSKKISRKMWSSAESASSNKMRTWNTQVVDLL